MSMNPGATTFPCASIFCFAGAPLRLPIAAILPVANAHVARVPRRSGPVDDVSMQDHDVERLKSSGFLGAQTRRQGRKRYPHHQGKTSPTLHALVLTLGILGKSPRFTGFSASACCQRWQPENYGNLHIRATLPCRLTITATTMLDKIEQGQKSSCGRTCSPLSGRPSGNLKFSGPPLWPLPWHHLSPVRTEKE